jgi:hypothetical protein
MHVSGLHHRKGNSESFFFPCPAYAHAPQHFCHHDRSHLDREMAGRWIGRSGPIAWPPRSPDLTPRDFFLWAYVKNIVYQVKINDLQHMKGRTKDTMATVTPNMLQATWNEVDYRLDICRATKGAHTEIYWESCMLRKNFDSFPL